MQDKQHWYSNQSSPTDTRSPSQRLSSTKASKDDDPIRTEVVSPTSPVPETPLTPTDPHPPAAHRRSKLDPTIEIELRRACAIILRDLKPSGHDLEDTRMKQDILVEALTPPNEMDDVPKLPMLINRSGQRASQIAKHRLSRTMESESGGEGSWPLSQTMSNASKGRRSRPMSYDSLSGRPIAYDTKARVDALMGSASGPTSPLREEFASGLAPTQTRTIASPINAQNERPLAGYLLEDYFQAPEKSAMPNAESLSSNDSSVTNHTGSTNHGRSVSTELSSTAFTTPALASNRVSGFGAATTASSAWPPNAERKTFDTVEEGEQDSMLTKEEEAETIPQELPATKPLAIKEVIIPSRRPSAVPATNARSPTEAQAVPITLTNGYEAQNGEKTYQHLEVKPLTIRRVPSKDTSVLQDQNTTNVISIFNAPKIADDINGPLVELPNLPAIDYDKPLPPTISGEESPEEKKENMPPSITDEYSQIKAMKLANIKDKSEEPLAQPRAKLISRPNSIAGPEALALPNYAGFDAPKSVVEPIAEVSSLPASRPETAIGQTQGRFSPMPENAATAASKTHQWPITAPIDQITPMSDAAPTPLVRSTSQGLTTHQQDSTVYVKDFWRPVSPSRPRSRVSHFSNEPNVQSREAENEMAQKPVMLNSLNTDVANASLPEWTAGPDTSIFNPRSATPDSPVSNMVRALPSTSTRPKSPGAPKAGSRTQSTTSTLSAPPLNASDNKSLPPLPRPYAQEGYFPNTTSNTYQNMTPTRSMTSMSYGPGPNTSTTFQPLTTTTVRTPTFPQTPQQVPGSATASMTNLPHPRTTSALSNPQTTANTMKSLSHRNIPPYIPGYGHIDPNAVNKMKRQSGITAPYSSPQKPGGIKGVLFRLGGGDMPAKRGGGGSGGWKAPPVSAWGNVYPEDGLYEDDYDDLACAAPVVPFGRGW